jgi:eukaryotic-like serine/threonine-protein kinase
MPLLPGARLGPYEVVSPLGAGGMGEVYRARDPRLARDVAVKVLPASLSADADRMRRFEQEAQAAGALNHPGIISVYDIGTFGDAPYVVTELLEGETLRSRLAGGALPVRKATEFAIQIAYGLAAAHEKGIVHRDLKPENLFVTREGRIKILDFGLAKLTHPEKPGVPLTEIPTQTAGTEPGIVMGTVGYMSPEQVRGLAVDGRSDIFAFGAILYEMLSGQRAFYASTAADTMTAILTKDPPDLSATNRETPPGLERIVRHCLEKNVSERFQSSQDVAFDLEALSGIAGSGAVAAGAVPGARRTRIVPVLVAIAVAFGAVAGILAGKKVWDRPPLSFQQLSFRRGQVFSARFGPDGQTIFYTAAWEGRPMEIFASRVETPESRPFGLPGAEVLAVSRSGEMAVSLGSRAAFGFINTGMLARVSATGGAAPRDVLEDVQWADWAPGGDSLAVVRQVGPANRLEYPIGTVLYQTTGWISHPRVSPEGDRVAFLDHPIRNDDGGTVAVVDLKGHVETLSKAFSGVQGLAWSRGGEIWFTAAAVRANRDLYSVTLSGRPRVRARLAGSLTLHDVSADGRILVARETFRMLAFALAPGADRERELTWLDYSIARDLSSDGRTLLFAEEGEGSATTYSVYLRQTDGSPPVRIGEGEPEALSPDGKWALSIARPTSDPQLVAYPTGAGEPRLLPRDGLTVEMVDWAPDGKRVVFSAKERGRGVRIYVRGFPEGKADPVSPEGYRIFRHGVSPDGRFVLATGPDQKVYLYPLKGGEPKPLPGSRPGDIPNRWTADGRAVYVHRRDELPPRVYLLDVMTGRKELWKELVPADSAGVTQLAIVLPSSDGRSYAYSYARQLSDLYVVGGLR